MGILKDYAIQPPVKSGLVHIGNMELFSLWLEPCEEICMWPANWLKEISQNDPHICLVGYQIEDTTTAACYDFNTTFKVPVIIK